MLLAGFGDNFYREYVASILANRRIHGKPGVQGGGASLAKKGGILPAARIVTPHAAYGSPVKRIWRSF